MIDYKWIGLFFLACSQLLFADGNLESFFGNEPIYFVQIGSNDGKFNDPLYLLIHKKKWKGILVEPQKYYFERLKENYKNVASQLQFENIAISTHCGFVDYYYVDPKDIAKLSLPQWVQGIGSLIEEHISSSIPEAPISKKTLPCLSLEKLLEKYQVVNIDLLHIDTEGLDFMILMSLNFQKFRPRGILFEHKHMDGPKQRGIKYELLMHYLSTLGYKKIFTTYEDTFVAQ